MKKIFNLTSTFKSHETEDGSVMIRGMASTADFDRAGDSISCEAWQKGGLSNFEKNPIILFNHDYDKPIGRATGLKAGPDGLELEAKISKAAPANVAQLVKDGVLGAFSVGFRVKDADYLEETDGLKIKDAELFEVSVVSVPCNQSATFSLAKSFDSDEEYNEFKKTFTNRVDLAGQSLAKDEVNTSSIASDTPKSAEKSADQEIKMDNKDIDLEAFAKQVAEDTAAKIAMKQAEQKAAEEAQAKAAQEATEAKALEAESIKSVVNSGVESGVEKLMGDVEAKLAEKDANINEVIGSFKKELEEKSAELEAMRKSKRQFSDRKESGDLSKFGEEFMHASLVGTITGKGWNTDYAQGLFEKAGVDFTNSTAANLGLDQEVSGQIEKKIQDELKLATLFREITVNGKQTVLPVQPDGVGADWANTNTSGRLSSTSAGASAYNAEQVVMTAQKLVSSTFLDNDTDEEVLINLMPMVTEAIARAHARKVEQMVVDGAGNAGIKGLRDVATAATTNAGTNLTASVLLAARSQMGRFGVNPSDLTIVVSQDGYYDLLNDPNFQTLDEVGSDLAARVTGTIGALYGSQVVVSEELDYGESASATAATIVYNRGFVIPRLRGVNVEQDYEVLQQRRVLVASQSLGFTSIYGDSGVQSAIKVDYA